MLCMHCMCGVIHDGVEFHFQQELSGYNMAVECALNWVASHSPKWNCLFTVLECYIKCIWRHIRSLLEGCCQCICKIMRNYVLYTYISEENRYSLYRSYPQQLCIFMYEPDNMQFELQLRRDCLYLSIYIYIYIIHLLYLLYIFIFS